MSGKQAKRERQAIRAAGGEDKITRARRIQREEESRADAVRSARAEALANETPEQRELRKLEDQRSERRILGMMATVGALCLAGMPSVPVARREPRYQRRGR